MFILRSYKEHDTMSLVRQLPFTKRKGVEYNIYMHPGAFRTLHVYEKGEKPLPDSRLQKVGTYLGNSPRRLIAEDINWLISQRKENRR